MSKLPNGANWTAAPDGCIFQRFVLPWPPSVNHYWRHIAGKTLISKKGRMYRREIHAQLLMTGYRALRGARVGVDVEARPSDRRRRDLGFRRRRFLSLRI